MAYTYFCLSIISLIALLICLYIFCSFRSLSCPRLTVHKHLMVSFILFYFSIIVYLEPYVSFREGLDYRDIVSTGGVSALFLTSVLCQPWLCKSLLILQVYSQMAAANWSDIIFITRILQCSPATSSYCSVPDRQSFCFQKRNIYRNIQ